MPSNSDESADSSDSGKGGKMKAFLWCREESYGYTKGNTLREKEKNYKRGTTFRLKPIAHIPDVRDGKVTSMQFHVRFFLTKNESTISIKHPDLYDFKKVCAKIMSEFSRELADGAVSQSDFRDLMERHIRIWSSRAYAVKEPVRYIGLQKHILPEEFSDWREKDMEWFFNSQQGVLGIDGKKKVDPKTVYVRELLQGVPQIEFTSSGSQGFAEHLEPPYASALGGVKYMESVCCGANIALMTWHAGIIRAVLDKLGMVCIAGAPNVGKTKELKVAMHMASSNQYFFAMKATPEFIQSVCEKVALLVSYDDNDSLRNEEVLGVTRFDGGIVGTKAHGIQDLVGEIVLTSNDMRVRATKMKLGRIAIIVKEHAGFEESENMYRALKDLAELTKALKTNRKPFDFLIRTCRLWFKMVPVPAPMLGEFEPDTEDSQMMVWLSQTSQMIRDITGSSTREIVTLASLHLWPHLYDEVLPMTHTWWKNGGSHFYYSVYLPKMLALNSGIYGKELANPDSTMGDRFLAFTTQILDTVDVMLEETDDQRKDKTPGDCIPEVKIVWAACRKNAKDLYLCMINKVNYSADFETDDSVGVFKEFFRTNRGVTDYRLYSEYAGKTTHIASSMPISYFKTDMRKRLMKTLMREGIVDYCKKYGSVQSRKKVEKQHARLARSDTDYDDSEEAIDDGGDATEPSTAAGPASTTTSTAVPATQPLNASPTPPTQTPSSPAPARTNSSSTSSSDKLSSKISTSKPTTTKPSSDVDSSDFEEDDIFANSKAVMKPFDPEEEEDEEEDAASQADDLDGQHSFRKRAISIQSVKRKKKDATEQVAAKEVPRKKKDPKKSKKDDDKDVSEKVKAKVASKLVGERAPKEKKKAGDKDTRSKTKQKQREERSESEKTIPKKRNKEKVASTSDAPKTRSKTLSDL